MNFVGIESWDGWPDGPIERDFTKLEFQQTARLRVHWAVRANGGYPSNKNTQATEWENGLKTRRVCLGVIECDDPICQIRQFEALVKAHPKSGPLQLIVGVPQLEGPGKSVADISDVLLNAHRVGKERQKIKHGQNTQTGDGLIALFAEFDSKHPGFIMRSVVGTETVVSLQTNFMRSQLVKKKRLDGPINGLVNDAAHGFWVERTSLLMISSMYCPVLFCWVPGVMSYTNGASAIHFQHHFIAVLTSIAHEATAQNIPITDDIFAGVCSR
ncbi:hypothetical protein BDZ97DRAFT_1667333 [Flammula alnicola]|nr:hypothetical protein BDZ97DRAFT_1667333 [Flammula alnicola]